MKYFVIILELPHAILEVFEGRFPHQLGVVSVDVPVQTHIESLGEGVAQGGEGGVFKGLSVAHGIECDEWQFGIGKVFFVVRDVLEVAIENHAFFPQW